MNVQPVNVVAIPMPTVSSKKNADVVAQEAANVPMATNASAVFRDLPPVKRKYTQQGMTASRSNG